jgi:hypothetical protein
MTVFSSGASTTTAVTTATSIRASVSAAVFGQNVTFMATLTASSTQAPGGTVQFQIDGTNAGSPVNVVTSAGVTTASFSTTTLAVGSHTITAIYGGSGSFARSTGTLAGGLTVSQANTNTVVVASTNPSQSGQPVTFTATVTVSAPSTAAITPTGVVTFLDGTTPLGTAALAQSNGTFTASFTTANLSVGTHNITATYGGDSNYLTSTVTIAQTITDVSISPNNPGGSSSNNPVSTTTSLFVSSLAVPYGQPIVLIATVTSAGNGPALTTGSVTFMDQGSPLGTVQMVGTALVFNLSTLSPGKHELSAVYSGDVTHVGSSSDGVTVVVGTLDQQFVGGLYQTLLERQPDPGGLATWMDALDHGVSRTDVAQQIQQSAEARGQQVQGLYHQYLHRSADPSGLSTFVGVLLDGGTLEQVSATLTSSTEYLQVRSGGSNAGFVTSLYNDALGRAPASGELAAYTNALNAGLSPSQVATSVTGSTESLRNLVANSYQEFLKRPADNGGMNSYVKAMQAGSLDQDNVAAAMLGSEEFLSRV